MTRLVVVAVCVLVSAAPTTTASAGLGRGETAAGRADTMPSILPALPQGTGEDGTRAPGSASASARPRGLGLVRPNSFRAAVPNQASAAYWIPELRRRWLKERREGRLRANTIRRLRAGLRGRVRFASGLERAFMCVHSFEGAWTSNTGNGYFGGLQMDAQFERTYGAPFLRAWGHAHAWPVSVQLAVGMAAYLSGRGFGPWPNTRRMCGL